MDIIVFQNEKSEAIDSNVSHESPFMCVLSSGLQYCVQFEIEALGGSMSRR